MPKQLERESAFWARLVSIDAYKGKTQAQIGKSLGIGQSAVTKWRTAKGLPQLKMAIEIAEKNDRCVEWLLTGRGPERPEASKDPETSRMLRHWRAVTPEARQRILHMAQLEHAQTFTGDPVARAKFEQSLVAASERIRQAEKPKP